ncbi:MAG: hypothetical protein BGP06_10195 [Rhizobiales bacterium 65-9]|nr:DUF1289 domain-containing protein [Hyphomicrobiales bacterium]OJY33255.1 MAG: hypothetical protein BGP06_10195 [Rhizobiales bacterium 65-9]
MSENDSIATPCLKICVLDPATRVCEGCGRTLEEIARWRSLTPAEREAVMADLPRRLARRAAPDKTDY